MEQETNKIKEIPTKEYAKGLAGIVTLAFWAVCIGIGYFILAGETATAVIFLLCLGFFLPMVVWAVVALIREKHSGVEVDMNEIKLPFMYSGFFLFAFAITMFLCFQAIPGFINYIHSS